MLTPENSEDDISALLSAISSFACRVENREPLSVLPHNSRVSIREAMLSSSETVDVESAVGRVLASPTVSCPPAVPIVVSGEEITEADVRIFKYYGIDKVSVIK